jgi:hypothetical protein
MAGEGGGGGGVLGWLRARRESGRKRTFRIDNSIRLPWGVGLFALLVLALASALLVGRTTHNKFHVPQALIDDQEAYTQAAAQGVRRSLNAGESDLELIADAIAIKGGDRATTRQMFAAAAKVHKRYKLFYCHAGAKGISGTGMQRPKKDRNGDLGILQFASSGAASCPIVVAEYDPSFLRFPLQVAQPGDAWVVNVHQQVVTGLDKAAPFSTLTRPSLRQAAKDALGLKSGAKAAGGSLDNEQVIGWAPVAGRGVAAKLGLGVVTVRAVKSLSLPQNEARRHGLLVGAILALLTILIFGWLYIVVFVPLFSLQREAERLAYGDLAKNVEVVRYDEIGLTARALERLRILLIRKRVQDKPSDRE